MFASSDSPLSPSAPSSPYVTASAARDSDSAKVLAPVPGPRPAPTPPRAVSSSDDAALPSAGGYKVDQSDASAREPPDDGNESKNENEETGNDNDGDSDKDDIIDRYFAASTYRLAALISAPALRPRAILDDYQLAPFQDVHSSNPFLASQSSAEWRKLSHLPPPLPSLHSSPTVARPRKSDSGLAPTSQTGPPIGADTSKISRGWRRVFNKSSSSGPAHTHGLETDQGEKKKSSTRRFFGRGFSSDKQQQHGHHHQQQQQSQQQQRQPQQTNESGGHNSPLSRATLGPSDTSSVPGLSTATASSSSPSTLSSILTGGSTAAGAAEFGPLGTTSKGVTSGLGAGGGNLLPAFAQPDKPKSPGLSEARSGSRERVQMQLPPATRSSSHSSSKGQTGKSSSRSAARSPSGHSSSQHTFAFDAALAQQRGRRLWQHLLLAADQWPALHTSPAHASTPMQEEGQEEGVLAYSLHSPTHCFLSQLTWAEFLLVYSLGALDSNSFPPFPLPPLQPPAKSRASTAPAFGDAPAKSMQALSLEEDLDSPRALHDLGKGLPKPTDYGSALLDAAAAQVVDEFMSTRSSYQKHAGARAARLATARSPSGSDLASSGRKAPVVAGRGTSHGEQMNSGGAFARSRQEEEDSALALDTESAVDALEDAAVGSLVEAHVGIIRFLASFQGTQIPAPLPVFERQRVAALHLNRPLCVLYQQAIRSTPVNGSSGSPTSADTTPTEPSFADTPSAAVEENDGLAQVGHVARDLALHARMVLDQLENALPEDMAAYIAAVDERWAVPLICGRRWRESDRPQTWKSSRGQGESKSHSTSNLARTVRPRWHSPEAHALLNRNTSMIVRNTFTDPRFATASGSFREEKDSAGFFAAEPLLSSSGMPIALLCITAPAARRREAVDATFKNARSMTSPPPGLGTATGSMATIRPNTGEQGTGIAPTWNSHQASLLHSCAEHLMALLEHAGQYTLSERKKRMVQEFDYLQAGVGQLGLTANLSELGFGVDSRYPSRNPNGFLGVGFGGMSSGGSGALGLEEEVQESLEKEQLLAAFQERMAQSRKARSASSKAPTALDMSAGDGLPDASRDLLPRLSSLVTSAAARGLGADMVYLARRPVYQAHLHGASPLAWTIVGHFPPSWEASSSLHPLTSCNLSPAAHNVHDHSGLPALFYNVSAAGPREFQVPQDVPDPSLPWRYPWPEQHSDRRFRSGVVVPAGEMTLPCLPPSPIGSDQGPISARLPEAEERSRLVLVILFTDRTRLLTAEEQGFVASLAGKSITWLRQAGALDAHIRTLSRTPGPEASLSTPAPSRHFYDTRGPSRPVLRESPGSGSSQGKLDTQQAQKSPRRSISAVHGPAAGYAAPAGAPAPPVPTAPAVAPAAAAAKAPDSSGASSKGHARRRKSSNPEKVPRPVRPPPITLPPAPTAARSAPLRGAPSLHPPAIGTAAAATPLTARSEPPHDLAPDPSLAVQTAASIFAPASARARREEAELGQAAAVMMQTAYRQRRTSASAEE